MENSTSGAFGLLGGLPYLLTLAGVCEFTFFVI